MVRIHKTLVPGVAKIFAQFKLEKNQASSWEGKGRDAKPQQSPTHTDKLTESIV